MLVDFWLENYKVQVEARSGLFHIDLYGGSSDHLPVWTLIETGTQTSLRRNVVKSRISMTMTESSSKLVRPLANGIQILPWTWIWASDSEVTSISLSSTTIPTLLVCRDCTDYGADDMMPRSGRIHSSEVFLFFHTRLQ